MPECQNMRPLVSIITPVYNHAPYIRSCIESVLEQTYPEWEQIIIDDGSSDSTGKVISEYSDSRIRYEYQSNRGPFALALTYNHALSSAKGELIAILEGDDFWPSNKLETAVPAFEKDDVVLAYGEAVDVDPKGTAQARESSMTRLRKALPFSILHNDPVGASTRHMLSAEGRTLVSPSTVIIRRRDLDSIGGFQYVPGLPLTDYPTFIKLSLLGEFRYFAEILGYRRRHGNSITVNHERTIHEMVSKFTLEFLNAEGSKLGLSLRELQTIKSTWCEAEEKLNFSEGRLLLLQKRWADSRVPFRAAAQSRKPGVRIAAWTGLICSWMHTDIEMLMKRAGRAELGQINSEVTV